MMDKEYLKELLERYIAEQYSENDIDELLRLSNEVEGEQAIGDLVEQYLLRYRTEDTTQAARLQQILDRADRTIKAAVPVPTIATKSPKRLLRRMLPYAAAILLFLSVGLYSYYHLGTGVEERVVQLKSVYGDDVAPGGNRATITLSDGKVIELAEDQQGVIASGTQLSYVDGEKLLDAKEIQYATLQTPRGGQYRLTLPDGTKVILNAESSVTYPTSFADNQRKVELKGEAFFDVAENKVQPFIVATDQQQVTVTGTTFNVNAYGDNNQTITTLVTGSVNVKSNTGSAVASLKPGQEALYSNGTIKTKEVDTHVATGWTDGVFLFRYTTLAEILPQLERWYDIQVDINPIPDEEFYAEIDRNKPLSTVLKAIEKTGDVRFEIKERRLTLKK